MFHYQPPGFTVPMPFDCSTGASVRAARSLFRVTQEELGWEIGYSQSWVSGREGSNGPLASCDVKKLEMAFMRLADNCGLSITFPGELISSTSSGNQEVECVTDCQAEASDAPYASDVQSPLDFVSGISPGFLNWRQENSTARAA